MTTWKTLIDKSEPVSIMNKKEEKIVIEAIGDLIPPREHTSVCMDLFIIGHSHENCKCKCHKKGSPVPSKERSSAV